MPRLIDRLPERALDPLAAPGAWARRRLDALHEADLRRRVRLLERRAGGMSEPAIEDIDEDDDFTADEASPHRIYRRRRGDRRRDQITIAQQLPDDSVRWIEPFTPTEDAQGALFQDDFYSDRLWGLANSGSGGIASGTWAQQHPGIITLQTGATNPSTSRIFLTRAEGAPGQLIRNEFDLTWIVRPSNSLTSVIHRLGMADDWGPNSLATPTTDWFGFEVDRINVTDTTWHVITRSGGVETDTDTGVTVSLGSWYRLRLRYSTTGGVNAVDFEVAVGTTVSATAQHTTNVPTTALNPGAAVRSASAANKGMDLDYFSLLVMGLQR